MTATKISLTALNAKTILFVGDELTAETAKSVIGRIIHMPTLNGNETADYKIESVSHDPKTDTIHAWMVRSGHPHGRHVRLVAKK